MIRPLVIENSSRTCVAMSQPAFSEAGVMSLVQMSRSDNCLLLMFHHQS